MSNYTQQQLRILPKSQNAAINMTADFRDLAHVEDEIDKVLRSLIGDKQVQDMQSIVMQRYSVRLGKQAFDEWFAEVLAGELHVALTELREAAVDSATRAGAGRAASSVLRSQSGGRYGKVSIEQRRKRISSVKFNYPMPSGGKSGIRRNRTVSGRTKMHYELGPLDRQFILNIFSAGTDVRTAMPDGATGRGSKSTHGRRGSIGQRPILDPVAGKLGSIQHNMAARILSKVQQFFEQNTK